MLDEFSDTLVALLSDMDADVVRPLALCFRVNVGVCSGIGDGSASSRIDGDVKGEDAARRRG